MATFIFWQSIFILSIILSIVALFLLNKLPESRINKAESNPFDYIGLAIFIIIIGSISFVIIQGYKIGLFNFITVNLFFLFLIYFFKYILFVIILNCIYIFLKEESVKKAPFIDLELFKNRPYIGAVVANFLLNTGVGVIALFNMYVQGGLKLTAFQAGLLTLPYLIS